jgi:hypothetical protein
VLAEGRDALGRAGALGAEAGRESEAVEAVLGAAD